MLTLLKTPKVLIFIINFYNYEIKNFTKDKNIYLISIQK